MTTPTVPTSTTDPINARILEVSEDRIAGFVRQPFKAIAEQSGVELDTVLERIRAMLVAGTIRRVRQTLLTTSLAPGALIAWRVPPDRLDEAFDDLFRHDPFSGHVVVRSTDADTAGAAYRLWTTLKVPQGFSLERHCEALAGRIGAEAFRIMPAKKLFKLGVGHVRRRGLKPGDKSDAPGEPIDTTVVPISAEQWRVIAALKREFTADEIAPDPWSARAAEIGLSLDAFCRIAGDLDRRHVIGRFSTFLEHVKKVGEGGAVTRYNALFHWAAPPGRELEAGGEVARFHVMTHAYWREGGPEFNHVNVMGVAHGTDRDLVLAHKRAIDEHLAAAGIPVGYTNVFWGGRSEIKPSEIMPQAYAAWCRANGIDPDSMRA